MSDVGFDDLFKYVDQQVVELTIFYKLLKELYGNEETVGRMNTVAPGGFHIIQRSLQRDIIVRIYSVTDKPSTGGSNKKNNASIMQLFAILAEEMEDRCQELDARKKEVEGVVRRIRTYRNKKIAHHDLDMAQGKAKYDPPLVGDLERAMVVLWKSMNDIRRLRGDDTTCAYEHTSIGRSAGGIDLALRDSCRMENLYKLARKGKINPNQAIELLTRRFDDDDEQILASMA
ncbi:MAG: hypothetical protein Kow00105_02770 [Phycisphaeraceae bacterium]